MRKYGPIIIETGDDNVGDAGGGFDGYDDTGADYCNPAAIYAPSSSHGFY